MGTGVGQPDRVEQRRDDRGEPAVPPHRVDQIEDEKRIATLQCVKMVEVEIDSDDLSDEAKVGERRGNGLGADQRVDLVWTVFRRGMHNGDEAVRLERHQARLRVRFVPGRARP